MSTAYRHISVQEKSGVLVLTIGLARVATYELAESMGRELIESVRATTPNKVVVELSQIEYMSSVGYGPLISLHGMIRDAGGRLILCGLSPVIRQMFEATRLLINPRSSQSLFEFTDTVENAVAMLRRA